MSNTYTQEYIFYQGSEQKAMEFLEFMQMDRKSFTAAAARFDELHIDQDTKVRDIGIGHLTKNYLRPIQLLPKKTSFRKVQLLF